MRLSLRVLLASSLALLVAGCAGSQSGPALVLPPERATAQSGESFAKARTLLFAAGGDGVHVFTESGNPTQVFAKSTGANSVVMDDAGNVYVQYTKASVSRAARYAIGGSKPTARYTPSTNDVGGLLAASHQGELIWLRYHTSSSLSSVVYDIWDPGASGKPSRTFTYPTGTIGYALDNEGTLYIPYHDLGTQTQRYDVIPAGASAPSRTIVDTLVTGSTALTFAAFTMTALSDGTLDVGEWTFIAGDPLAGLYVYPLHGKERFVSNGASAPTSTAVDANANVYVLNSNFDFQPSSGTYGCDTLHTLSVYSPGAMKLLSQATSGFIDGQALTVSANGRSFISEFPYFPSMQCSDPQGSGAIAVVPPNATSGSTLVSSLPNSGVVIYDGVHATNPYSQAL